MTTSKHRQARFTLVELLTVMSIIFILAALLVGVSSVVSNNMHEARTKARLEAMMMALQEHFQDRGYYPQQAAAGDLNFTAAEFTHTQTGRPYLEGSTPGQPYLDGWQRPFQYSTADAGGTPWPEGYHLWSNGRDRNPGTADDISSWKQR